MCCCCDITRRPAGGTDCLDDQVHDHGTHDHGTHDSGGGGDGTNDAASVVTDFTALLRGSSFVWSGVTGQSAFVTYSFETAPDADPDYSAAYIASFRPFTAAERTMTREALDQWADASGLVFLEVGAGEGDIAFRTFEASLRPQGGSPAGFARDVGRTFDPATGYAFASERGGDVVMDDDVTSPDSFRDVVLHEIGHAIGYKHTFEGDPVLRSDVDNTDNSVMSYTNVTPAPRTTLGPLDIDAVRHTYGTVDGGHLTSWEWNAAAKLLVQVGTGAADKIAGVNLRDIIAGGRGDDQLAGFAGDDRIMGDDGDDAIGGGRGNDRLFGGAGDDRLHGGDGDDALDGGTGDDVLRGLDGNDVLIGGAGADELRGDDGNDRLDGGEGGDELIGGGGNDRIDGGGESDLVFAQDGDDVLIGLSGDDRLYGGAGDDVYYVDSERRYDAALRTFVGDRVVENAGEGTDTVVSYASLTLMDHVENAIAVGAVDLTGNDLANALSGSAAANTLDGGAGDDVLRGGAGNDVLRGGAGSDRLIGGGGFDTADYRGSAGATVDFVTNANAGAAAGDVLTGIRRVFGSDERDVLRGAETNDGLIGGAGADVLIGRGGADVLTGATGNDYLAGGAGNDRLIGGQGRDVMIGGAGADRMDGGFGFDTANYSGGVSVTVDLKAAALNDGAAKGDVLVSVEKVIGSTAGDRLSGSDAVNVLDGGGGNDLLLGRGGNDKLIGAAGDDRLDGGAGADILAGGAGTDWVDYGSSATGVVADLILRGANTGHAKGDVYGSIENLEGTEANDSLRGNALANRLDGEGGNDALFGRGGDDTLVGYDGDDFLAGGAGDDLLTGRDGNDILYGGMGADTLFDGAGVDRFVYRDVRESAGARQGGTGFDVIKDLDRGSDRIDLSAIDANGAAPGNAAFTYIGARAFTGAGAEVRFTGTFVLADTDGDRAFDMAIEVGGTSVLGVSDFIL